MQVTFSLDPTHTFMKRLTLKLADSFSPPHNPALPDHAKPRQTRHTTQHDRHRRRDLEPLGSDKRPRRDDAPPRIRSERARGGRWTG